MTYSRTDEKIIDLKVLNNHPYLSCYKWAFWLIAMVISTLRHLSLQFSKTEHWRSHKVKNNCLKLRKQENLFLLESSALILWMFRKIETNANT